VRKANRTASLPDHELNGGAFGGMSNDLLFALNDMLERIKHATVATVSADGRPWNTPVYFARERYSLYWISRRDARHSTNIQQNGRAFVVVFDSSRDDSTGAGIYIDAEVAELTNEDNIQQGLELIYRRRNKSVPPASQFVGGSVNAIYLAKALRVWTNVLHGAGEIPWMNESKSCQPESRCISYQTFLGGFWRSERALDHLISLARHFFQSCAITTGDCLRANPKGT
jgi:nitroimidazol reductase NimA-like FMN-containing flavoprotein (pyridoxamine 5'-phosphate oxidase superfamily)